MDESRRALLKRGLCGLPVVGLAAIRPGVLSAAASVSHALPGSLLPADANGVCLPKGFRSRIIARSGQLVVDTGYRWHPAPDGGSCFATAEGGWIYVSNSEMKKSGGVSAVVFDRDGRIIDAYSLLNDTRNNCAGGATPWGSWLSCEEVDRGRVWECYPEGGRQAEMRPALGYFKHEAVAVDPVSRQLYLTEDEKDGCLYRFTASRYPDISAGRLEVAVMSSAADSRLAWREVEQPLAESLATRKQVAEALRFDGGEGIAYHDGYVFFTTKGDDRVWSYDTHSHVLDVIYDAKDYPVPLLTGVDNITVAHNGDIYVAEDGGDLQVVVIDREGRLYPVAQLAGHEESEVTGIAFSPDGRRLYFSSQRGETGSSQDGVTYEIQGF